jgi:hypothetical protein
MRNAQRLPSARDSTKAGEPQARQDRFVSSEVNAGHGGCRDTTLLYRLTFLWARGFLVHIHVDPRRLGLSN